jgi:hypothetical protein
MDGVTAKIAQKIGVLLDHKDIHSRPSQQETEHHSGRPTAHDAAFGFESRHHCFPLVAPSMI